MGESGVGFEGVPSGLVCARGAHRHRRPTQRPPLPPRKPCDSNADAKTHGRGIGAVSGTHQTPCAGGFPDGIGCARPCRTADRARPYRSSRFDTCIVRWQMAWRGVPFPFAFAAFHLSVSSPPLLGSPVFSTEEALLLFLYGLMEHERH